MNRNKAILTLLVTILSLLVVSPSHILAQEATTPEATTAPADEPIDDLEEDLLLLLPEETDNPNLTIAFNDPSGKGVQLKIDGQDYNTIESPYILPSLSIGKHYLTFKYTDAEEVEKEVERSIIIIPRAPVINPPDEYSNNKLVISGTAVPLGKIEIYLSGGTDSFRQVTEADTTGVWEYIFEQEFKPNVYSVVAFTKKDGYASTYSDPVVFSIDGENQDSEDAEEENDNPIFFDLSLINRGNIVSIIENNPHIGFLTIGAIILGFLFGFVLTRLSWFRGRKSSERQFMNYLKDPLSNKKSDDQKEVKKSDKKDKKSKNDSSETQSESVLKAKFEAAGIKTAETPQSSKEVSANKDKSDTDDSKAKKVEKEVNEDPIEEEEEVIADTIETDETEIKESVDEESAEPKKEKDSEMTKEEFLAKYKDHDPDQGKKKKKKSAKSEAPSTKQDSKGHDEDSSEEPEGTSSSKKSDKGTVETVDKKPKESDKELTQEEQGEAKELEQKSPISAEERKKQIEKSIKITLTSDSIKE